MRTAQVVQKASLSLTLWPVAFFNNDWWLLSVENGEAQSRGDWRIPRGRYGLGWWTINDPQHPDYKQLELISPRDPKPEVPSDEEEEEFLLRFSPRVPRVYLYDILPVTFSKCQS